MSEFDDPTADFLAREQAILGAEAALFGNPLATDAQVPTQDLLQPSEPLFEPEPVTQVLLQEPVTQVFQQEPVFQPEPVFQQEQFSQPAPVFQPEPVQYIEPEAITEWKQRFQQQIEMRDLRSKDRHDILLKKAQENLEKFYAEYNEKKAKQIQKNKETQSEKPKELPVWQSVQEMLRKRDKKDKHARFKQVLMSMS